MDSPFIYSTYVTGKHFVGRKDDVTILSNLMSQSENIVMYDPPKSGKRSLLQQALHNLNIAGKQFRVCDFSLMNVRTTADFITGLGSRIIRSYATTPDEYASFVEKYLAGTHFIFDPRAFSDRDVILSLNWDMDYEDVKAVLTLPYRISSDTRDKLYVVLDEFQNIMFTEDGDRTCKLFEEVIKESSNDLCAFIMIGSMVNAMKDIFVHHGYFYRLVNRVELTEIGAKEAIDCAVRGFLTSGKVVDRDLMLGACKLFRGNMWYINHFCSISDSLSKGYIMEPILVEALGILVSIHEPRFKAMMYDLTTFQVCFLRAVIDGHTKFSSSEVIQKYNLSSSANVRRLKDALCKKELITFDEKDSPVILDPLFEYWVRKTYFGIE